MALWSGGQLTAAGRILQAKVEAGTVLRLTKLKLGDGNKQLSEMDNATDLTNPRLTISISSKTAANGICSVSGVTVSTEIEEAFYVRELGLFAEDPDVGEILFSVAIDSMPEPLAPKTAASIQTAEFALGIVISNVPNINVQLDPQGLVTVGMLNSQTNNLERLANYKVEDLIYDSQLRPGLLLKCIKAGTSGKNMLVLNDAQVGDEIADGTSKWQVVKSVTTTNDVNFVGFKTLQNGNITIDFKKQDTSESEPEDNTDGDITYADNDVIDSMFN